MLELYVSENVLGSTSSMVIGEGKRGEGRGERSRDGWTDRQKEEGILFASIFYFFIGDSFLGFYLLVFCFTSLLVYLLTHSSSKLFTEVEHVIQDFPLILK